MADDPDDIEIVIYVDDDDNSYDDFEATNLTKIRGPRKTISKCWNDCWAAATGEIFGHMGDDIRFRTEGWDTVVRNLFASYPDRIVFAYGDDGMSEVNGYQFGTHGFIHKNWTDVVGRFVPDYFESDYNDTWLNDIAKALDRHEHIPIMTEHLHFSIGKSLEDQNTRDRLQRHASQHPEQIYESREMRIERQDEIEKLRSFIEHSKA